MLRVSVLMFLAPTLANVYQATRATEKANVKVHISQNLVSIKNCYIHNANVFKGLAISKGGCAGDREVVGHPFFHPVEGVGRSIFS